MIADLFWDLATSTTALSIVAAILIAALIVSHLPLMKMIPTVAPYVILAGFVAYLALADLALCIGFRIADERAETQRLKTELAWSANQLEQQKATAEDAERLKGEAEAAAQEAKGKLDEFRKTYADAPEAVCAFSADDLKRLRALRRAH